MVQQESLQINANSQSAGCHTASATNSVITGPPCALMEVARKSHYPVGTHGKYAAHTAEPISVAGKNSENGVARGTTQKSNVQHTAGSHNKPDLSDRDDRAEPTDCHDSELCHSASETRNTEMIRRKLSVNHIHDGSGIDCC